MKDFNVAIRGERVKPFPSSKAAQLNSHVKTTLQEYTYDAATIHLGINDIPRCKTDEDIWVSMTFLAVKPMKN